MCIRDSSKASARILVDKIELHPEASSAFEQQLRTCRRLLLHVKSLDAKLHAGFILTNRAKIQLDSFKRRGWEQKSDSEEALFDGLWFKKWPKRRPAKKSASESEERTPQSS